LYHIINLNANGNANGNGNGNGIRGREKVPLRAERMIRIFRIGKILERRGWLGYLG